MVAMDRAPIENDYFKIKWSLTADVTWPWKVKVVTIIRLETNISKMAGDRRTVSIDHQ